MIHKLEPQDYEKARPLFARWRPYLVIFAVIDRNCPGKIVVDDRETPRTALLWEHAEGELYLTGTPQDERFSHALNHHIRHQFLPYARAHLPHLSEYTLYCDPDVWEPLLDRLLAGLNPMQHRRKLYRLKAPREDWHGRVPDGFRLTRIDEQLFQSALKSVDVMREWVLGSCSNSHYEAGSNDFSRFGRVRATDTGILTLCVTDAVRQHSAAHVLRDSARESPLRTCTAR